jgi:hypothetical protein
VTVHEKLSLKEQIKVFNNFGIMIASHSSQLKNLIFAPRNAIIIVTRPTPVGYLEPNNFALGMREIDLIFEDSVDHLPDYSSCPEKHGCKSQKRYKTNYWLKEELFERSLLNALSKQSITCGNIWNQN